MADRDTTTKEPQADGQDFQASLLVSESSTPSGQVVGEHCVTDRPTPHGQAPTGEISSLGGTDVYVSKPSDYPHTPSRLLLLLTGGTGIRSTNNQLQADKFASAGFVVLMPDLFAGDVAPPAPAIVDDSATLIEQVKIKAAEVTKSFLIDMWIARVTADKVMPILHRVIDAAKDEYADAIEYGHGIYAVGYCVGGRFVLLLAKEAPPSMAGDESAGQEGGVPCIRAGALAHAASVTPSDFDNLKAPLSLVCVEDDPLFPDEVRSAGVEAMAKAKLEHQVKVYPGVPHGFAVVGAYADEAITSAQSDAYEQMLQWIKEH